VRVALFDDGQKRAAVIALYALLVIRKLVLDARAQVEKATGFTDDAELICASYSLSSGPDGMLIPGEHDTASDLVKNLTYEESSCADATTCCGSRARSWQVAWQRIVPKRRYS
jgi:neutral ceramidase